MFKIFYFNIPIIYTYPFCLFTFFIKKLKNNHVIGWGQSFHFARMFKGDTFIQNLSRHENFLAMHLNLRPGMKVLDVGCGVGKRKDFHFYIV